MEQFPKRERLSWPERLRQFGVEVLRVVLNDAPPWQPAHYPTLRQDTASIGAFANNPANHLPPPDTTPPPSA